MKTIIAVFLLLFTSACLGNNDPGIFGEYTTYNQCLEKPGYEWRETKYFTWDTFPGCKEKADG